MDHDDKRTRTATRSARNRAQRLAAGASMITVELSPMARAGLERLRLAYGTQAAGLRAILEQVETQGAALDYVERVARAERDTAERLAAADSKAEHKAERLARRRKAH